MTARYTIVLKVAARFVLADQGAGARKDTKDAVSPINKPKGLDRGVVKEFAETVEIGDDSTSPDRRDLRPVDVFVPTPNHLNVLNYVRNGWPGTDGDYSDMETTIRNKIPKDKGYGTVSNLSQYLIETEGGGGTPPVGT